jgi:hypothetical protein
VCIAGSELVEAVVAFPSSDIKPWVTTKTMHTQRKATVTIENANNNKNILRGEAYTRRFQRLFLSDDEACGHVQSTAQLYKMNMEKLCNVDQHTHRKKNVDQHTLMKPWTTTRNGNAPGFSEPHDHVIYMFGALKDQIHSRFNSHRVDTQRMHNALTREQHNHRQVRAYGINFVIVRGRLRTSSLFMLFVRAAEHSLPWPEGEARSED